MAEKEYECCICGRKIDRNGEDSYMRQEEIYCDDCTWGIIVPRKLREYFESEVRKHENAVISD